MDPFPLRVSFGRLGLLDDTRRIPATLKRLSGFAAISLLSCAVSAAPAVNIDFNASDGVLSTYSGTAAAPDTGNIWNGVAVGPETGPLVATFTSGALFASDGSTTPLTVTLGNFLIYEADERPAAVATALMTDFVFQQSLGPLGPASTFSINNLDRAFTYDVYLYSQNGGYASTASIFTINGISRIATNAGDIGTFVENTNYVLYEGLVPDVFGGIAGTFNSAKALDNAAFNGLQIVQRAAPPPPPPPTAARTINVDFNTSDGSGGTYSGQAAAPNSGTVWNGLALGAETGGPLVSTFTSGALVASDGSTATPVTVTLGNFKVYEADENQPAAATLLMTDFAYQQDLGTAGPDSTFSINNLDTAFTYDLYLYSQNGGYAGTATRFTIDGISRIATNGGNVGSLVEDTNYVLFQGLRPDAFGAIAGTFNSAKDADNGAFNGFQLVQIPIPEPTALSLLALAGLLSLRHRRGQDLAPVGG